LIVVVVVVSLIASPAVSDSESRENVIERFGNRVRRIVVSHLLYDVIKLSESIFKIIGRE
jgi:hypothetical protein